MLSSWKGRSVISWKDGIWLRNSYKSRYVLTGGFCIYSHEFNRETDSILFIPTLKGGVCPYGMIVVRRYFYPEEYKDSESENYALLELQEDVGDYTGFIEMRSHTADEIDNKECFIYGYPGRVYEKINHYLYGMSGIVSYNSIEDELRYDIDTQPGVGGAGIYYKSPVDDKYYTIGIHLRGNKSTGYNSGVFLSPERIERIKEWINSITIKTIHNLAKLTSEVYGRDSQLNRLKTYFKNPLECDVVALAGIAGVGRV